jgi:hypothetical protein
VKDDVMIVYEGSIVVSIEGEHLQNLIVENSSGLKLFKWILDLEEVLDCAIFGMECNCFSSQTDTNQILSWLIQIFLQSFSFLQLDPILFWERV